VNHRTALLLSLVVIFIGAGCSSDAPTSATGPSSAPLNLTGGGGTSIHGVVWIDRNGDGARDPGETGLAGVTVYLDLNTNQVADTTEPRTLSMEDDPGTDFDEAGLYWLDGLSEGAYSVREIVPDGYLQTFPPPGEHDVDLAEGETREGVDFGNRKSTTSAHGVKWNDRNGNGERDPDEPGLGGVTIYADLNTNGALDPGEPRAVSMMDDPDTDFDEAGMYWLDDVPTGEQAIREEVPGGFEQTYPASGEHRLVFAENQVVEGLDFGNRRTAGGSVRGVKWLDADRSGSRDSDEPGLPGVVIYSDLNGNGVLDDGEPRMSTMEDDPDTDFDEAGLYWLDDVPIGEQAIREEVPDGFVQTFPPADHHRVDLETGDVVEGVDFGNAPRGADRGKVRLCHNGHVIEVSVNALPAHLAHGDVQLGEDETCREGRPGRGPR